MKALEPTAIEQLLSIIPNHPATRIMHISDGGDEVLCERFKNFVMEHDYDYLLNIANETFYTQMRDQFEDVSSCNIKKINLQQRVYAPMAKLYDFVFVTATLPESVQNTFIQKIHLHIKSSGNIILFLPKNERTLLRRYYEDLEEHLYVAMNTIDIFENYEILIARKMHGWGGEKHP